jgi:WD40 repeat protein
MAPALTRPTAEIAALRRLAAVYRRLLLLAVPAALAGCQDAGDSLGPAADPAVPPVELAALSTPRIAFTSARSGGGDIYLTDPTGTQPATRLTTSSAYERAPAWSWDNKRMALVRPRKDNSDVLHDDIYVINATAPGGTGPVPMPRPGWSPHRRGRPTGSGWWSSSESVGMATSATST